MNVRRRGFTLIEILITIGIIMVLVAIVTVGVAYVSRTSRVNSAKVTLNNLKGMVSELDAVAGLKGRQPAEWQKAGTKTTITPAMAFNAWLDYDFATPTAATNNEPALVPNLPVEAEVSQSGGVRYDSDLVVNTQLIMELLLAVPRNKDALAQMPGQNLMEKLPGTFMPKIKIRSSTDRTPSTPIVLDPWGNPIVFVPGSGLAGRDTTAPVDDAMWVGSTDPAAAEVKFVCFGTPSANKIPPIQAPDKRPFWASAGPDGDFRTGDDNVYSFEN